MWCYVHAGRHNPDTVAAEVTQNVKHIEREGERQGESEREREIEIACTNYWST